MHQNITQVLFLTCFSYSLEVINSFQQSQHWRLALDLLPSPFASNVVATCAALCAALGAAPWPQALQLFVPLAQQRVANLVASTAMAAAVCRADAGAVCSEVLAELQGRSVSFLWQKMEKIVIMLRMWSVSKCNGSFFDGYIYILLQYIPGHSFHQLFAVIGLWSFYHVLWFKKTCHRS